MRIRIRAPRWLSMRSYKDGHTGERASISRRGKGHRPPIDMRETTVVQKHRKEEHCGIWKRLRLYHIPKHGGGGVMS